MLSSRGGTSEYRILPPAFSFLPFTFLSPPLSCLFSTQHFIYISIYFVFVFFFTIYLVLWDCVMIKLYSIQDKIICLIFYSLKLSFEAMLLSRYRPERNWA